MTSIYTLLYVLSLIISQHVGYGILTYEPASTTSSNEEKTTPYWQTILRTAVYQTISKYTGFSPSLDIKMEADSLLWEKLDGAKFTRKLLKPGEEDGILKTGVLLDLSRENGHLEFRQVEKSFYKSAPDDHRLLVLWRLRLVNENHFLITVKIPEVPPMEYLYEYEPTKGLREVNLKNFELTKNKHTKNNVWKTEESYTTIQNTYLDTNRKNTHHIQNSESRHYPQQHKMYRNQASRTYLDKPAAQYFTIVGFETAPLSEHHYTTWNRDAGYYTTGQTKSLPEFKTDTEYNGFIPSLGPTGNPIEYTGRISAPETYRPITYFPPYSPEPVTQKSYPMTYFKPSTQFIQYSEIDPFYASNNSYTYTLAPPTSIPILHENVAPYPQLLYNTQPTPAISVQAPQTEPGFSLYEIALNAIKNENDSQEYVQIENTPQTSVTSLTYDQIQQTENINEKQFSTEEQNITTESFTPTYPSDNRPKSRVKNSLRNSQRNQNKGYFDYAPLYIQWGNKIKPNTNKVSTTEKTERIEHTTTELVTQPISENTSIPTTSLKPEINEKKIQTTRTEKLLTRPKERIQELQRRRQTLKLKTQERVKLNNTSQIENKPTKVNSTEKENEDTYQNDETFSSTNVTTVKTPEEVVRDLTTLGLTENPENSANIRTTTTKEARKLTGIYESESQHLPTEPVSVVVSRISQSVSYKTSVGQTGNLKSKFKN